MHPSHHWNSLIDNYPSYQLRQQVCSSSTSRVHNWQCNPAEVHRRLYLAHKLWGPYVQHFRLPQHHLSRCHMRRDSRNLGHYDHVQWNDWSREQGLDAKILHDTQWTNHISLLFRSTSNLSSLQPQPYSILQITHHWNSLTDNYPSYQLQRHICCSSGINHNWQCNSAKVRRRILCREH
jgi:hypothetical protein